MLAFTLNGNPARTGADAPVAEDAMNPPWCVPHPIRVFHDVHQDVALHDRDAPGEPDRRGRDLAAQACDAEDAYPAAAVDVEPPGHVMQIQGAVLLVLGNAQMVGAEQLERVDCFDLVRQRRALRGRGRPPIGGPSDARTAGGAGGRCRSASSPMPFAGTKRLPPAVAGARTVIRPAPRPVRAAARAIMLSVLRQRSASAVIVAQFETRSNTLPRLASSG